MKNLLVTTLALLICASSASAAELLVAPDGSGPYPTIQAAIDDLGLGDEVVLMAGIYTGPDNRNLNIDATVTIRSQYPGDEVIIDLQGSEADPTFGWEIVDGTTTLEGVTLRNGYGTSGGAVNVRAGTLLAIRCSFLNNTAARGGAISCDGGDRVELTECILAGNTATVEGGAIYANIYGEINLTRCTLFMNECDDGSAIFRRQEAPLNMEACLVAFGRGTWAFSEYYGGPVTIANTNIWANEGGDWTNNLSSLLGTNGNIHVDPELCDPMAGNFDLASGSPCWIPPATTIGAGNLDPAWPAPVYGLLADGTGMYATIQDALVGVPAAAGIALADGTYQGAGNVNLDFLGKEIDLHARSIQGATIDATSWDGLNRRAIWLHNAEPVGTTIRDIVIRNGATRWSSPMMHPGTGGGLLVSDGASVALVNVSFSDNTADQGGAVGMVDSAGEVTIDRGDFTGHMDPSVVYAASGSLTLSNVSFSYWNSGSVALVGGLVSATLRDLWVGGCDGIIVSQVGRAPVVFENCDLQAMPDKTPTYVFGSDDVDFLNCEFFNVGNPNGEHLQLEESFVSLADCQFRGATPNVNVAAINATNTNLSVYRSTFTDFQTAADRGVLDYHGMVNSILSECTIANTTLGIKTHAPQNTHLTVSRSTFDTVGLGARIEGTPTDDVYFTNTEFIACTSGLEATNSPSVRLTACSFRTTGPGVPVTVTNSSLTVSDCEFNDADVADVSGVEAGGISSHESTVTVVDSAFQRNTCEGGPGGLYAFGGEVTVDNCLISDNTNLHYDRVGTVGFEFTDTATIRNSRLLRNSSYDGGAISSIGADILVEDTEILDNSADHYGGGLALNLGLARTGELNRCLIAGNTAAYGGGLHITEAVSVQIDACTFYANGGAGGAAQITLNAAAAIDIAASIIAYGSDGPAFVAPTQSTSPLSVTCTDIFGHSGGDWVEGLAPLAGVAGNLEVIPGFCDPAGGDLHLVADSPCLAPQNSCGVDMGALGAGCAAVSAVPEQLPLRELALGQNYPNPFNPATEIRFALPDDGGFVALTITGVDGRHVRRLVSADLPGGEHTVTWRGRDDNGRELPSGVYFVVLRSGGEVRVNKLVMVQ